MKKTNSIKIISDGTPNGTKITDSKGKIIDNIVEIDWKISVGNLATATLKLVQIPVHLKSKRNILEIK